MLIIIAISLLCPFPHDHPYHHEPHKLRPLTSTKLTSFPYLRQGKPERPQGIVFRLNGGGKDVAGDFECQVEGCYWTVREAPYFSPYEHFRWQHPDLKICVKRRVDGEGKKGRRKRRRDQESEYSAPPPSSM